MTFSGLSEREAEASRQKYGLNEQKINTESGSTILHGLASLSCKLFMIAAMIKIVILLLGLLEIIPMSSDILGIFILAGLAFLSGILEGLISSTSESGTAKIYSSARQGEYTVLRDGKVESVAENLITVGDVIFISEGDRIPADGIVADGQFVVDQSEFGMLEKISKTAPPQNYYGNKGNSLKSAYNVYSGSVVCEGSGAFKVTAVGNDTLSAENERDFPRIHGEMFDKTASTVGITGGACALAVLIIYSVMGGISGQIFRGVLEGLTASAIILALTAFCGSYTMVSAVSVCVMKRLSSLGVKIARPDLLCGLSAEKSVVFMGRTGILSDGNYRVHGFIDGNGNQIDDVSKIDNKVLNLFRTAVVNTSSAQLCDGIVYGGTSADRAILRFISGASDEKANVKKQAETRKGSLSAVTVSLDGKLVSFISGAAEVILSRCSDGFSSDGKKRRITNKDALSKLTATIALTGNDVRAFAVSDRPIKNGKLPEGAYTLIGMTAFCDKLSDEAAEASAWLEKSDVKTVLLTEASRETAIYTLKTVGVRRKGVILDSAQLAKMKNSELEKHFDDIKAVVGASPDDKRRMMRTAEKKGLKICTVASSYDDVRMFDESDVAIASPVCATALRRNSDASVWGCGIKAVSELFRGSAYFVSSCRILFAVKILCIVALSVISVVAALG